MASSFKKTKKVKLDLLTQIDMLLMIEKEIREEICFSIYRYTRGDSKHMKDYDKNLRIVIYSILGCK